MKFLCLGYLDREKMKDLSQSEIDVIMRECRPYSEKLYNTGQVIVDTGLEATGKSVRRLNGRLTITDGPFTETKEMIGGAFLIEANDMDEAIRIASLHPAVQMTVGEQFGWRIDVRPVHTFESPELKV
ncbi:MAG: YciI family protein [Bacteroidota bacterium]|nr:YciI family protein [Bacteroidota bacterium]